MHKDVRPARFSDIPQITSNLMEDDRREFQAAGINDVELALKLSLSHSPKVFVWEIDGVPAAIFGVTAEGDAGHIWALPTPLAFTKWRTIHREMPNILRELGQGFLILTNIKDARNKQQVRWLRSLGFTFIRTIPSFGPQGLPFHEFVRIAV